MQSVMDTSDSVDTERSGVTRRQIIQGAALGGAAFWAVPVIDSVTNMAAAVGSGGVPYCYIGCIEQSNCGVNPGSGALCGGGQTTTCSDAQNDLGVGSNDCPGGTGSGTSFLTELCIDAKFYNSAGTQIQQGCALSGVCSGQGSNGSIFAAKVVLTVESPLPPSPDPCKPGKSPKQETNPCNSPRFAYGSAKMANGGLACYSQLGDGSSTSNVVTISGNTLTFDFSAICTSPGVCSNVAWNDLCFQVDCNGFT